jgi:tetratricopeptide (TPR) repeat protein
LSEKARNDKEKTRPPSGEVSASGERIVTAVGDLLKNAIPTVTDYRCANHPARIATAFCESCGTDLCSRCYIIRRHKTLCFKCMGALDSAFGGKRGGSQIKRILTHPLTVTLVLACVLANVLFACGKIQRKGLLGMNPTSAAEAEEKLRLSTILFAQKADRIESHGDSLKKHSRPIEANWEYEQARSIYESLKQKSAGRWEEKAMSLAIARLFGKMGRHDAANAIYEHLIELPGDDRTFAVIGEFHLAKFLENSQPERSLELYRRLIKDVKFVSEPLSRLLNSVAHSERAYNYETRIWTHTRNNFDFERVEAESCLQMGRVLVSLERYEEAEYWLRLAIDYGTRTKLGEEAMDELRRTATFRREPEEKSDEKEKKRDQDVVITHFE